MKNDNEEQIMISNERAIANLMVSYAYINDDADLINLGDLFEGASIKIDSVFAKGREEVKALAGQLIELQADGRSATTHEITNIIIDIAALGKTATGSAYWTLYKTISGSPREAILSGRYQDRFSFVEGLWTFTERYASILWKLDATMFA